MQLKLLIILYDIHRLLFSIFKVMGDVNAVLGQMRKFSEVSLQCRLIFVKKVTKVEHFISFIANLYNMYMYIEIVE